MFRIETGTPSSPAVVDAIPYKPQLFRFETAPSAFQSDWRREPVAESMPPVFLTRVPGDGTVIQLWFPHGNSVFRLFGDFDQVTAGNAKVKVLHHGPSGVDRIGRSLGHVRGKVVEAHDHAVTDVAVLLERTFLHEIV